MYLMSLTNWDYIWITAFLAASFSISYLYRRKNPSSDAFLTTNTKFDILLSAIGEFGILEIILAGMIGSYYGFTAIYYVAIVVLLQLALQKIMVKRYAELGVENFNDYLACKFNKPVAVISAILNAILLIMCISLVITIVFKSLQALMGFGFINNVMGLLGFAVMCLLIGGRTGSAYIKLFYLTIIFVVFLAVIILGINAVGGFGGLLNNLSKLAIAKSQSADYYTAMNVNGSALLTLLCILIGLGGYRLISYSVGKYESKASMKILGSAFLIVILILPGVIALGTTTDAGINGKKIVTVMAQQPDGQTAYVVKAVDSAGAKADTSPGIIPPLLNTKTNLLEEGKYNYYLANIVVFRHYLPKQAVILALIMVFAGFMVSIFNYMAKLGQITVNNILVPLGLIAKYEKIGELWSLQVAIVGYTGLSLAISYFLFLHFDLLLYVKVIVFTTVLPLLVLLFVSFIYSTKKIYAQKK